MVEIGNRLANRTKWLNRACSVIDLIYEMSQDDKISLKELVRFHERIHSSSDQSWAEFISSRKAKACRPGFGIETQGFFRFTALSKTFYFEPWSRPPLHAHDRNIFLLEHNNLLGCFPPKCGTTRPGLLKHLRRTIYLIIFTIYRSQRNGSKSQTKLSKSSCCTSHEFRTWLHHKTA